MRTGVVLVVALALASAASADPAVFNRSGKLEPAASFVAGKPVQVMCAATWSDWRAWIEENGRGEANGTALVGGDAMHLSPDTCRFLRDRQRGRTVDLFAMGGTILVLTHESIHLRGERDEGVTDCSASHEMVAVAQRFFGFKDRVKLRALMAKVAKYRSREAPQYRTVC